MNPSGFEKIGTAGIPIPGTDIKVIDENGVEQEVGGVGELCVRGPQVMAGYWQREEQTAEVIVDGWLHTGDIVMGGFEKKWPRGKKESFYRDDLLCILIQYLITAHNMKTRAVFGKEQSAPVIVFEAFQRLGFKDRLSAKDYAKRWDINRKRSSYATDYFKRKARNLAELLQASGWAFQETLPAPAVQPDRPAPADEARGSG